MKSIVQLLIDFSSHVSLRGIYRTICSAEPWVTGTTSNPDYTPNSFGETENIYMNIQRHGEKEIERERERERGREGEREKKGEDRRRPKFVVVQLSSPQLKHILAPNELSTHLPPHN